MQGSVSIRSLGIQVATRRKGLQGGSGRETGRQRGSGQGPRERGGRWTRRELGPARLLMADRLSPILDEEVHYRQRSLAGDSDGQVQGELSRCLDTHTHTWLSFSCHLPSWTLVAPTSLNRMSSETPREETSGQTLTLGKPGKVQAVLYGFLQWFPNLNPGSPSLPLPH